jgi:hypothetical protein
MDTGTEFYYMHHEKWINWADGFMLVYAIDSQQSFEAAAKKRFPFMHLPDY